MPMDQPETKPAVAPKRPELLMAAREGDPVRLNDLLSCSNEPALAWTAITIDKDDSVHPAEAVTSGLDSILHVVASAGDSAEFLESASMIHSKARHLLDATDSRGDTPLHCAARAGRIEMVSHLISLARAEAGDERVKAVLRKQNRQRETALHEALRLPDEKMVRAMVERLMSADPQLARLPEALGASPLYVAVLLGQYDTAKQLHDKGEGLSYCGPDGQNVMHAAVLQRNIRMTDMLIKWGEHGLIKQGDQPHGSTPLHLAASCGNPRMVMLLLDADKSSAYQFDNKGSLPIHVAAVENNGNVVCIFLKKCPGCAEVRDAEGRTFLHVAIDNRSCRVVWAIFNRLEWFVTIVNMRDRDGNTGLHLAVQTESVDILYCLLRNKRVLLNLRNSMGRTALDLVKRYRGLTFVLDPRSITISLLYAAGAEHGAHHQGGLPDLDVKKEATMISESIQTVGLISGLLFTVCFAAAFAIPGGYRAGDDAVAADPVTAPQDGTPVLATSYSFQGFVVANNVAVLCSALAMISLGYAGMTNVHIRTRLNAFSLSIYLIHCSFRSLAAAFAFGTEAMLAPVARTTVLMTWIGLAFTYLDIAWLAYNEERAQLVLRKRLGIRACFLAAAMILYWFIAQLWPYVIILGLLAYYKTHGIH